MKVRRFPLESDREIIASQDGQFAMAQAAAPTADAFVPPEDLPGLYNLALSLARGDTFRAQDYLQDAAVAGWKATRDGKKVTRGWYAGTLRHLSWRNWARERTAFVDDAERIVDCQLVAPEELAARKEALGFVLASFQELEDELSDVILLYYFDGLTRPEISKRTRLSVRAIEYRLDKGLERMREHLERTRGKDWAIAIAPAVAAGSAVISTALVVKLTLVVALLSAGLYWVPGLLASSPAAAGASFADEFRALQEAEPSPAFSEAALRSVLLDMTLAEQDGQAQGVLEFYKRHTAAWDTEAIRLYEAGFRSPEAHSYSREIVKGSWRIIRKETGEFMAPKDLGQPEQLPFP